MLVPKATRNQTTVFKSSFFAIILCVSAAWPILSYASDKDELIQIKKPSACKGVEHFGDGSVRVEFPFLDCKVPQKSRVLVIQNEYIKSCNIPNYKKVLSIDINTSSVSHLQLGLKYPEMIPTSELGVKNSQVIVNLSTKSCDGKDSFDSDSIIKNALVKKSPEGQPLYGDEEVLLSGIKKYRSLTKSQHHDRDVYLLPDSQLKKNIIIRCKKGICQVGGYPFLEDYYLSYTFDESSLGEIKEIKESIQKFLLEKSSHTY